MPVLRRLDQRRTPLLGFKTTAGKSVFINQNKNLSGTFQNSLEIPPGSSGDFPVLQRLDQRRIDPLGFRTTALKVFSKTEKKTYVEYSRLAQKFRLEALVLCRF